LAALKEKLDELNASFDDRLAKATDEVVHEAQTIEKRLENLQGKKLLPTSSWATSSSSKKVRQLAANIPF
jgi:hypothetical protein